MVYYFSDEVDGEKVSSLIMYVVRLPSRKLAVIEEVKTEEGFRRQGRATKLIKKAISAADSMNLDCVELTCREDTPEVYEFYKSLGFVDRQNRVLRLKV